MAELDALTPAERRRLERFGAAFERLDAIDYEQFAGTTASDAEIEAAQEVALALIGSGSHRSAVRRAVATFTTAADQALLDRMPLPQLIFGSSGVSARAEDRVRLRQSLERAVVAVILWEQLDESNRDILLGPWGRVVDRAFAGPG